jgi:uncharacterized membrane protein
MARTNHRIERLAEHFLSEPLEKLNPRQLRAIERALRRQSGPPSALSFLEDELKWHERLADQVAVVGGSWTFICVFAAALLGWAALNSFALVRPFDPFPYIFLNLLLSTLAAVQAPVIMMSQNRMAAHDRLQATRDFEVNLKAELEILALHEKLDRLLEASGVDAVDR